MLDIHFDKIRLAIAKAQATIQTLNDQLDEIEKRVDEAEEAAQDKIDEQKRDIYDLEDEVASRNKEIEELINELNGSLQLA